MEKLQGTIFQDVLRESQFPVGNLRKSLSTLVRACNMIVQDSRALWYQELPLALAEYLAKSQHLPVDRAERTARYYFGRARRKEQSFLPSYLEQAFNIEPPIKILEQAFKGNVHIEVPAFYRVGGHSEHAYSVKDYALLEERARVLNPVLELYKRERIEPLPVTEVVKSTETFLSEEELKNLAEQCNNLSQQYTRQLTWVMENGLIAFSVEPSAVSMLENLLNLQAKRKHRVMHIEIPIK